MSSAQNDWQNGKQKTCECMKNKKLGVIFGYRALLLYEMQGARWGEAKFILTNFNEISSKLWTRFLDCWWNLIKIVWILMKFHQNCGPLDFWRNFIKFIRMLMELHLKIWLWTFWCLDFDGNLFSLEEATIHAIILH